MLLRRPRRVLEAPRLALPKQPLAEQHREAADHRGRVAVDRRRDLLGSPAPLGRAPEQEQHLQLLDRLDVLMKELPDVIGQRTHPGLGLTSAAVPA
jgi:hypothetical protein